MFETANIPPAEDMATFRRTNPQIAAAKQAAATRAEATRTAYVERMTAEDVKRGISAATAARKWDSATCDTLPADFDLHLASGFSVTVQEILDDPASYKDARCADPLDPDYRDDSRIAVIYPESQTVFSHAHGGTIYRMEGDTSAIVAAAFAAAPYSGDTATAPYSGDTASAPYTADTADTATDTAKPPPPRLVYLDDGDPAALPLTPWLVETLLLRGEITVLAGHGATGKSLLAWSIGLGVATGRAIGIWPAPPEPCNVLALSGEDDPVEMKKRVVAACRGFGIPRAEINSRFACINTRDIRLVTKSKVSDLITKTPLFAEVSATIKAHNIGLLIIDPLVKTNAGMLEVDNNDMDELFKAIRDLIEGNDCAALVVDHFNKSGTGDQNSLRGASAKVNASRITVTLTPGSMLPTRPKNKPALPPGIDAKELVHCVTAKINYGKKPDPCFFRLVEYAVGNGELRPALQYVPKSPAPPPLPDLEISVHTWEHRQAFLDLVATGRPLPYSIAFSGPKAARLDEALVRTGLALDTFAAEDVIAAFQTAGLIEHVSVSRGKGKEFTGWKVSASANRNLAGPPVAASS